ncbi:MAG: hypothetical protein LUG98_02065 [Tannerellaceae bacterium]|nr:hypothetical protein [Tannerellaceae bacterium]
MKTSCTKFIICFLFSIWIGIFISSCTSSKRLILNGEREFVLLSECGSLTVRCYWAYHRVFIEHHLTGKYTLYPDSLKLGFYPDSLETRSIEYYSNKRKMPIEGVIEIEDEVIRAVYTGDFHAITKDGKRNIFILPSNYIMCNDQPLIRDTITITWR